ncbi:aminotransferase class V-fold PLP-dependent enzyme [Pseudomonas sp. TE50-2]|jgi:selenocysteine lyase/cysteine desulfurase|uniref:aminotransferase class V-fold PLP-dependent enzyme n=1 Tax=Pseudomonas sp. TE50-2 TaxID=3142707 RepID=UPI003466E870
MQSLTELKIEKDRLDLPCLTQSTYVDSAAVTPLPRSIQNAMNAHLGSLVEDVRMTGERSAESYEEGRRLAAKLVGSVPERIAYIQNTSHGMSLVALGIDWNKGDNLVVAALEFPSNYLCWMQLAEKGVEIRKVDAVEGRVQAEDFARHIDSRTRLVAVSHVQYYSGYKVDLAGIAVTCAAFDALLVVDGTQSIGAMTLDVTASGVDVLVVSAHKWLMGPRGIGFMSFSERAFARITPRIVGWLSVEEPFAFKRTLTLLPDARRFEAGTENGAGIIGLAERLRQIDGLGAQRIEDRVLDLNQRLLFRCQDAGLEVVHPFARHERSGICLVRKPGVSAEALLDALEAQRICASLRNGAIRLSPHYFNTHIEIENIVATLQSVKAG